MIKSIYATDAVLLFQLYIFASTVDSQITNVVEKFCFIYSFHLHFAHKSNCIRRMQYQMLNFSGGAEGQTKKQRVYGAIANRESNSGSGRLNQNKTLVVKCKFVNKNPNRNFLAGYTFK